MWTFETDITVSGKDSYTDTFASDDFNELFKNKEELYEFVKESIMERARRDYPKCDIRLNHQSLRAQVEKAWRKNGKEDD